MTVMNPQVRGWWCGVADDITHLRDVFEAHHGKPSDCRLVPEHV